MAFNFLPCDRDQPYLLPPSLKDWLPEDHLAWFLLDVVDEIDLRPFYAVHREDGWGAPAFEPKMMLALLRYAYCTGERSSRRIERRCHQDIAFHVITANAAPDHSTIARFRQANEQALAACFTEVLRLCAAAGLIRVGVVSLDGTKVEANASLQANRSREAIEAEVQAMLAEAAATDRAEDDLLGEEVRGDELPPGLATRGGRLARLKECRARLEEQDVQARYAQEVSHRAAIEAETGKPLLGRPPKPKSADQELPGGEPDRSGLPGDEAALHLPPGLQRPGRGERGPHRPRRGDHPGHGRPAPAAPDAPRSPGQPRRCGDLEDHRCGPCRLRLLQRGQPGGGRAEGTQPPRRRGERARPAPWRNLGQRCVQGTPRTGHAGPACDRTNALRQESPHGRAGVRPHQGCPPGQTLCPTGLGACDAEWKLVCATHNLLKLWRHSRI